jgi:hypothetical protein
VQSERTPDSAGPTPDAALSERDAAILAFEQQWWRHAGAKEEAIRTELGVSAARYYQLLGVLIDSPVALASDPMLVKRLQRMRHARAEARSRRSMVGQGRPGEGNRAADQNPAEQNPAEQNPDTDQNPANRAERSQPRIESD